MSGYAITLLTSFPFLIVSWLFQNSLVLFDVLDIKDIISVVFNSLENYHEIMSKFGDASVFMIYVTLLE
ncbi:MAG: hypothetical protein U0T60_00525 [Buchnera aphidicola (Meitanaphis microgallis)]